MMYELPRKTMSKRSARLNGKGTEMPDDDRRIIVGRILNAVEIEEGLPPRRQPFRVKIEYAPLGRRDDGVRRIRSAAYGSMTSK